MESMQNKFYYERFNKNKAFQNIYLQKRISHYKKVLNILKVLNVHSIIDFGCAYGLLVEMCNEAGMNAYGFDLPIENLIEFHKRLFYSLGKFVYGSINDEESAGDYILKNAEAFIYMDTLRCIVKTENIKRFNPSYIIIKEISNNLYLKWERWGKKRLTAWGIRNYTPLECLSLFNNYYAYQIYPSKYIFKINDPSNFTLRLINTVSPTYTLVLKHK